MRAVYSHCAALLAIANASACTGEAQPRPVAPAESAAKPSGLPFPDTAFRSETEGAPAPDRFITRRIAAEGAPDARFRGAPVDVDVKDADVRDVFRLLADVGKTNIVVASEVAGTVTMRLRQVPWDQAIDVVARARGLVYAREGNVIVVRSGGR
jgi:type IV pilus assembly protein PilQ